METALLVASGTVFVSVVTYYLTKFRLEVDLDLYRKEVYKLEDRNTSLSHQVETLIEQNNGLKNKINSLESYLVSDKPITITENNVDVSQFHGNWSALHSLPMDKKPGASKNKKTAKKTSKKTAKKVSKKK